MTIAPIIDMKCFFIKLDGKTCSEFVILNNSCDFENTQYAIKIKELPIDNINRQSNDNINTDTTF